MSQISFFPIGVLLTGLRNIRNFYYWVLISNGNLGTTNMGLRVKKNVTHIQALTGNLIGFPCFYSRISV